MNMVEMGFTEKQYFEEFAAETLGLLAAYFEMREAAHKIRERRARNQAKAKKR